MRLPSPLSVPAVNGRHPGRKASPRGDGRMRLAHRQRRASLAHVSGSRVIARGSCAGASSIGNEWSYPVVSLSPMTAAATIAPFSNRLPRRRSVPLEASPRSPRHADRKLPECVDQTDGERDPVTICPVAEEGLHQFPDCLQYRNGDRKGPKGLHADEVAHLRARRDSRTSSPVPLLPRPEQLRRLPKNDRLLGPVAGWLQQGRHGTLVQPRTRDWRRRTAVRVGAPRSRES
jgi:hypothetical protein